jgi:hypothetical protein
LRHSAPGCGKARRGSLSSDCGPCDEALLFSISLPGCRASGKSPGIRRALRRPVPQIASRYRDATRTRNRRRAAGPFGWGCRRHPPRPSSGRGVNIDNS